MELELLQNQLKGLEAKKLDLKAKERLFLKASGLDESIERGRQEIEEFELDSKGVKEDLAELTAEKIAAVVKTTSALADRMAEFLPEGVAIIDLNGDVKIGWLKTHDKQPRPYAGLSGGEKTIFDAALCHALLGDSKNKVIILEAGEADADNLDAVIKQINKKHPDAQIIVNCWHRPARKPQGWNLIELK